MSSEASGPHPPPFTIRRAVPADAPGMARAHARAWRATYPGLLPEAVIADAVAAEPTRAERWRDRLADVDPGHGAFVAEVQDQVVGFVFWGPTEDHDAGDETGEVQAIYVVPDAIGRGIGRALMAAATVALGARGFRRAVLWVLDSNARARRFYESAGWLPDGATEVDERPGGTLRRVRYARSLDRADQPPSREASSPPPG